MTIGDLIFGLAAMVVLIYSLAWLIAEEMAADRERRRKAERKLRRAA